MPAADETAKQAVEKEKHDCLKSIEDAEKERIRLEEEEAKRVEAKAVAENAARTDRLLTLALDQAGRQQAQGHCAPPNSFTSSAKPSACGL